MYRYSVYTYYCIHRYTHVYAIGAWHRGNVLIINQYK